MKNLKRLVKPEGAWMFIAVLAALLYLSAWNQWYVGYFGDDAFYVVLAKSILRGMYATIYTPSPVPVAYPMPGLPLLLSPFVNLVGPHWEWLKLIPLTLTLLSSRLLWNLLKTWFSIGPRICVTALYTLNPVTLRFSTAVMTEPFFIFSLLMILTLLQRSSAESADRLPWGLAFWVGWAGLIRPEAPVIIPAVVAGLLWQRRRKAAGFVAAVSLLLWGVILVRNHHIETGAPAGGYWMQLTAALPFLSQNWIRAVDQLHRFAYLSGVFAPSAIGLPHAGWGIPASLLCIALSGALLVAGIASLWKNAAQDRGTLLAVLIFGTAYGLVHVVWPAIDTRYVLPLLPFLLIFQVEAVRRLWQAARKMRWIIGALVLVIPVAYIVRDAGIVRDAVRSDKPVYQRFPDTTFTWIREHTPANAVLLADGAVTYLYTGRRALDRVPAEDAASFHEKLLQQGVSYVVYRPTILLFAQSVTALNPRQIRERNRQWMSSAPNDFSPVYENPGEAAWIYEVKKTL